jgi:hypothetical protein
MREGSPIKFSTADPLSGSRTAAKSLFRNILAVSPCGSRFWGDQGVSPRGKFLWINTLEERMKKIRGIYLTGLSF